MSTSHSAGISACAVSPSGSFFVSASRDNTLKLWDPLTGDQITTLEGHPDEVHYCAVGADNLVYSAGPTSGFDAVVKVWDPATGDEVAGWAMPDVGVLKGMAVSPGGNYLAALRDYGSIDLHDPETGAKLGQIDVGPGSGSNALAVAPDGSSIVVSCGGELRVFDPLDGKLMCTFPHRSDGPSAFRFTPDATSLFFFEEGSGWAIGNIASGTTAALVDDARFSYCSLSADGLLVAACCSTGTESWNSIAGAQRGVEAAFVRIRRIDSGELLHDFDLGVEEASLCAFSPDGSLLLAASAGAFMIREVASGEELGRIPLDAQATCMALHPSRPSVALGDTVGGFHVLDLGVEYGPLAVSAVNYGSGPVVRCPACNEVSPTEEPRLSHEEVCPRCGTAWRVNPFELRFRLEPLRYERPQQVDPDESKRFAQAQNRALFTATSTEDLAALSRKMAERSEYGGTQGRSGLAIPPPPTGGVAPTALDEEIKAMLLEELAEAGIDTDAASPGGRGMIMAGAVNAAVAALQRRSANILSQDQKLRLQQLSAQGNALEMIRLLCESLPAFPVLDMLREELKVAYQQKSDATTIQVMAIINDETERAGLEQLPAESRSAAVSAALGQAWKGLRRRTDGLLAGAQKTRLQELQGKTELVELIRFLQTALADFDVLGAYRAELKAAYPEVLGQFAEMNAKVQRMLQGFNMADPQHWAEGDGERQSGSTRQRKHHWFRRRGHG